MKKNLLFIWLLIKLKLSHMMVFRFNFFGAFIVDSIFFIVQLITFSVIYSQVDSIGNWSRGQMLIFIGTFSMINGLNMLIYFFGILGIPQKIRSGELDLYITKPGNALLRLTFEHVNIGSALLLPLSALIIGYGLQVQGINPGGRQIFFYSLLVLIMTLLYYDMELILRTIPFFTLSTGSIDYLEGELLTLNFKIPGVLFQGIFKILFYFVLPYGIMATVPTQYITGVLSPQGLILALITVIAFTAFALWFWRLGLKHYKSASS